jgi:hypothetical protein
VDVSVASVDAESVVVLVTIAAGEQAPSNRATSMSKEIADSVFLIIFLL